MADGVDNKINQVSVMFIYKIIQFVRPRLIISQLKLKRLRVLCATFTSQLESAIFFLENIRIITLIFLWTVTGATRRRRVAIATDWMTNCEWSGRTQPQRLS